jgi:positive regulator of sigma E activity
MQTPQQKPAECPASCTKCEAILEADRASRAAGLSGWRLVASTALVFLLPLACAIAGAGLTRGAQSRQVAGTLAGLAAGVILARALAHFIRPRKAAA